MPIVNCKCDDCGIEFEVKSKSEEQISYCPFCSEELTNIIEDEFDTGYFYDEDENEEL